MLTIVNNKNGADLTGADLIWGRFDLLPFKYEKFEDTKGVLIRSREWKDRQHNRQKKDKTTNNDLQYIT
jgi:hypothetical protein